MTGAGGGRGLHRVDPQLGGDVLEDARIAVRINDRRVEIQDISIDSSSDPSNQWTAVVDVPADITYRVQAQSVLGRRGVSALSDSVEIKVRTAGPKVTAVNPTNTALDGITVTFDEPIQVPATLNDAFDLVGEDVLITGAGPIGIMAGAIASFVGARHVVVTRRVAQSRVFDRNSVLTAHKLAKSVDPHPTHNLSLVARWAFNADHAG